MNRMYFWGGIAALFLYYYVIAVNFSMAIRFWTTILLAIVLGGVIVYVGRKSK